MTTDAGVQDGDEAEIRFKAGLLREEAERLFRLAETHAITTFAEVADRMNAAAAAMDGMGAQYPNRGAGVSTPRNLGADEGC
jgi:hypothetical protein